MVASNDWTFTTMLTHVLTLMDERDKRYEQRYQTHAESLQLARAANDVRLAAMNEFRAALTDQASTFLTYQEYNAQHQLLIDSINDLRRSRDQVAGRSTWSQNAVPIIISVAAVMASITSALILAFHK